MIIINKEERKNKDIKVLKKEENKMFLRSKNNKKGITLIALVITILFSYDYGRKCSNSSNKFLLSINC